MKIKIERGKTEQPRFTGPTTDDVERNTRESIKAAYDKLGGANTPKAPRKITPEEKARLLETLSKFKVKPRLPINPTLPKFKNLPDIKIPDGLRRSGKKLL